ncbi:MULTISPECIES: GNAT family N-acetyltransferase [Enterococcus]|uniref:GNAT family N-acetyltransferase n=1 Tax=Candidatus Enterococcus murrayae TaxID=2815321 RepID=A0ABS3HE51_9ENTE|nr:GNAT family N-acetyltransferase [Enterococcus sp. MJM16]MBO0451730.1 GNAT family N-acetyltransferase [Enterococcus sp. MJM16]
MTIKISRLNLSELPQAKKMIKKVFMTFEAPDYSDEGVAHFLTYLNEELEKELSAKQVQLWCGKQDQQIVGILAVRLPDHVALLFVDSAYHRQGIAKKMYQEMLSELSLKQVTVNSSPYAVSVYEKLGFQLNGKEETVSGIRFQPMIFSREDE